jgi:DNA polymerase Ligase (LigD)
MGRYVILRHECPEDYKPGVHWDLMLEFGDALRTWALAEEPTPGVPIAAEELPDHRLAYLDYEGPISGDRGTVRRWDAGRFELLSESRLEIHIRLAGDRVAGEARLTRATGNARKWLFSLGSHSPKPAGP